MKNSEKWLPSKYIFVNGVLKATTDKKELGVGSRLIASIIARIYDKNLKKYAKGKLLDLGCGKIPLYMSYISYVDENICVDWERGIHKSIHVDYFCDLNNPLPFPDNHFNTILVSDVLEHIPEPGRLWNELSRLLAPNGKIILNTPFLYHLHEEPYDFYRYTEYALSRFVERSGLKLIGLESIGGAPEVVVDIIAKRLQYFPVVGQYLSLFLQHITLAFIDTEFGENISRKTRRSFPLGYFLVAEK